MKILIAPDSFKGSLSSEEVCLHIKEGIKRASDKIEVITIPLADGGEGTATSLIKATGGRLTPTNAHDPLMRKRTSFFGVLGDNKTAVIEMASASGLTLLKENDRNPMITTTYGTGELIKEALDLGYRKILIGIGGSATTDGGMGMAMALGVKFLDENNHELPHGGGSLGSLRNIDISGLDPRISECDITVICDVDNPLCGPLGAAHVFSPQKGANKEAIKILDANLGHYAKIIETTKGISILDLPGAGAAGGLGGGLYAFLNARLERGIDIILKFSGIEEVIPEVDYIITGEGMIDAQTSFGKAPLGIARLGAKFGIPVIAFTGALGKDISNLYNQGFTSFFSIAEGPMTLETSIKECPILLENLGENIARLLISHKKI